MSYLTSIGLDVHARSISACALYSLTGEIHEREFRHTEISELVSWIKSFEEPHVVYESGVTGFDLYRRLTEQGVDCFICAVSRVPKPVIDKIKKTDKGDARMLARLDAAHLLTPVYVPSEDSEGLRDLCRTLDQARDDLTRARQRLSKFLLRHGYVFDETTPTGNKKSTWSRAHWRWIETIEMTGPAQDALDHYISEARHAEREKKRLGEVIKRFAQKDKYKERVDALCLIKGIAEITAISIIAEVDVFSRFPSARDFMSYLGMTPSEHSSGENQRLGSISKSGNKYVRKMLIESSWHYIRCSATPKNTEAKPTVGTQAQRIARKSTERLTKRFRALLDAHKKPVVANCAVARELAGFVWAIGCSVEGTLSL